LAELNNQQVSQVRLLLRALLSATNKLKDTFENPLNRQVSGRTTDPDLYKRNAHAVSLLTGARLRLEQGNVYDLPAAFLISGKLSEAKKTEEYGILHELFSKEPMLSDFGGTPWMTIENVFWLKGRSCSLALRTFHAEYQREYHVSFNLRQTMAPVPQPTPMPASAKKSGK
jgi:hypothetical protein